jgi:hypothetical protein
VSTDSTVIVELPQPDEQLPSSPLWTFIGEDGDGLVIASRPDQRHVVLTARESPAPSTVRLSPAGTRAMAAALLAAADHADHREVAR